MRRRGQKFTQRRYPIVAGKFNKPVTLIRLPEGKFDHLPPPDVETFFYQEEVFVPDDEDEKGPAAASQNKNPSKSNNNSIKKRGRNFRPSMQWVLEANDIKLYGAASASSSSSSSSALSSTRLEKEGSAYFLMKVDETKRETQMVPIEEIILLRQQANTEDADHDDQAVKDYIEYGDKSWKQALWEARYGKEMVAALANAESEEDEDGGKGNNKKRRRPSAAGGGVKRWRRTFKVDEDVEDDNFNPGCKTATNYNDIFALFVEGDDREALQLAFQEVDTGFDEIPDGADDGFGAPEFGQDNLPEQMPNTHILEEPDPILFGMGNSDGEEEDGGMQSSSEEEEEEDDDDEKEDGEGGEDAKKASQQATLVGQIQAPQKHEAFEAAFAEYEADNDDDEEEDSSSGSSSDDDDEDERQARMKKG